MNSERYQTKKRFGQHFLRDRSVIESILAAAEITTEDSILEIGPGMGALTHSLAEQAGQLSIMEVDRDLCQHWRQQELPNLSLIEGDALKLDWPAVLSEPTYTLVSNLPYNISSQIVFKVLAEKELFSRLVLMFQREVGERICAKPGGKEYGILSVLSQIWFDVNKVIIVKPGSFSPPPKVDSIVLKFICRAEPRYPVPGMRVMISIVKGLFAKRRKTLRNNLVGLGVDKERIDTLLEEANIDGKRRPETLAVKEFCALACLMIEQNYIDIQEK